MSDAIVRLPGVRGFIANLSPGVLSPGEIGIVINEDGIYYCIDETNLVPTSSGGSGSDPTALKKSQNLNDLGNKAQARVNLGFGNVDNTSDSDKPISLAMQNALATQRLCTTVS